MYLIKGLSTSQIADLLSCSSVTIINRLKELGIKRINNSGKKIKYKRTNFSTNREEEAYLIGFRLGDLNIYKTKETIIARCHTTDINQVKLMKKLFVKYGHVGISIGRVGFHINCFLNSSFEFLVPKEDLVPKWSLSKRNLFYSFIAGYTDAEGNFNISQGKARFKIDSYDLNVLSQIASNLVKLGIRAKYRIISVKGRFLKKDLWRMGINEARSLLKFMLLLKKYLKHKKRLLDMNRCIRNVEARIKNGTV